MNMKRIALLTGLIFSINLWGVFNSAIAASLPPVGIVEEITGLVGIKHKKTDKFTKAKKGSKIYLHDRIKTKKGGKVKIRFASHSSIHLGENSYLVVTKIVSGSKNNSLLRLEWGKLRAVVEELSSRVNKFEIQTKTAVVGAVGTDFIVSAFKKRGTGQRITDVICYEGSVSVRNRNRTIGGEILLNELEHTRVLKSKKPGYKGEGRKNKIRKRSLTKLINKINITPQVPFHQLNREVAKIEDTTNESVEELPDPAVHLKYDY